MLDKPGLELENLLNNPDHELFRSIIAEKNDIVGFKIEYYILDNDNSGGDYLLGEWKELTFFGPYKSKLVYEPTDEMHLLNAFGIFSDETIQLAYIAKEVFKRDVASHRGLVNLRPKVGDVIITLWDGKKYELSDVGHGGTEFLASKFAWEFIMKPFRYTDQSNQVTEIYDRDPFNMGDDDKHIDDFKDNTEIKTESDTIDNYDDVDTKLYGF